MHEKSQITNYKSQTKHKLQIPKRFWSFEFRSLRFIWNLVLGAWKFQQSKTGFTLLEMVISIGIFSILVISSIGITLGISNAQIKAQNIQTILDNVRFSLELITKEMRTGSGYALTSRCAPFGSEISFTTSIGEPRTYFLDAESGTVMRAKSPITSADCLDRNLVKPFTAEEVLVERLNFAELRGELAGPFDGQPRTTIMLKVTSRSPKYQLQSSIDMQTTVVQRLRDL